VNTNIVTLNPKPQETAARVKIEDSLPKLERQLTGVEEAVRLDQQTTSRLETSRILANTSRKVRSIRIIS